MYRMLRVDQNPAIKDELIKIWVGIIYRHRKLIENHHTVVPFLINPIVMLTDKTNLFELSYSRLAHGQVSRHRIAPGILPILDSSAGSRPEDPIRHPRVKAGRIEAFLNPPPIRACQPQRSLAVVFFGG